MGLNPNHLIPGAGYPRAQPIIHDAPRRHDHAHTPAADCGPEKEPEQAQKKPQERGKRGRLTNLEIVHQGQEAWGDEERTSGGRSQGEEPLALVLSGADLDRGSRE